VDNLATKSNGALPSLAAAAPISVPSNFRFASLDVVFPFN